MTNPSPTKQAVDSYERRQRKVHRGGRPKGDTGSGGRSKLTTTLHWSARRQLEELAATYGLGLGDAITLLLKAHEQGCTVADLAELLVPAGQADAAAARRTSISEMLKQIGQAELEPEVR